MGEGGIELGKNDDSSKEQEDDDSQPLLRTPSWCTRSNVVAAAVLLVTGMGPPLARACQPGTAPAIGRCYLRHGRLFVDAGVGPPPHNALDACTTGATTAAITAAAAAVTAGASAAAAPAGAPARRARDGAVLHAEGVVEIA